MTELAVEGIAGPVVVTGATGFIGRALVKRLRADGHEVVALALPADAIPIEWGDKVAVRRGDVTQRHSVRKALSDGAGTVFHLAAVVGDWGTEAEHQRVTARGTEHVLGECARIGARAILASSIVVYGHRLGREVCDEETPFGRPMGPYSRAKQEQERIARRIEATQSLKVTLVRPCNVYGPGSRPWVDLVVEGLRRGDPMLVGGGDRVAGITYVDNVVDVLVRAAERPAAVGRVYNANDDHGVTWHRYFCDLAELSGAPPPRSIPSVAAKAAACVLEPSYRLLRRQERPAITWEALNLAGAHHRVPIEKARRQLGYDVPVGYEQGIEAVARYVAARRST